MPENGKSNWPCDLEQLSVSELKALLQQDFLALNGSSPDVDFIRAVLEVIERKEQSEHSQPELDVNVDDVDVEEAWNDFLTHYIGDNKIPMLYGDEEEDGKEAAISPSPAPKSAPHRRSKKINGLLVAALLVLLIVALTCVPVFGFKNVVAMLAHWETETFQFIPTASAHEISPSYETAGLTYSSLPEALAAYGIETPVCPTWIPEGFSLVDLVINNSLDFQKTSFIASYINQDESIIICITQCQDINSSIIYEMNRGITPEVYSVNATDYFIFNNQNQIQVAWHNDKIECSILASTGIDNVKHMINSIYERL